MPDRDRRPYPYKHPHSEVRPCNARAVAISWLNKHLKISEMIPAHYVSRGGDASPAEKCWTRSSAAIELLIEHLCAAARCRRGQLSRSAHSVRKPMTPLP